MTKFAFYAWVAVDDQQAAEKSQAQLTRCREYIEAHGLTAAEYFDIGNSQGAAE